MVGKDNHAQVLPDGTTTNVTKSGATVSSTDPSARPDATLGEKLKGDFSGAVQKTVGSLQAATGAATKNANMHQQGLQKMQEEDQRIGAKHGVMPVGSGLREKATGVPDTQTKPL